jgi:pimeloyl-ACP methyl ester carboxylesterase
MSEIATLRDAPAFDRVARYGRTGAGFDGDVPGIPVTVAWGTHDRVLLPVQAARAHLQLPQARMIPLLDCGHVPMNDDPTLVATTILSS